MPSEIYSGNGKEAVEIANRVLSFYNSSIEEDGNDGIYLSRKTLEEIICVASQQGIRYGVSFVADLVREHPCNPLDPDEIDQELEEAEKKFGCDRYNQNPD